MSIIGIMQLTELRVISSHATGDRHFAGLFSKNKSSEWKKRKTTSAFCSCVLSDSPCHGASWWTERHEPKGWRCARCHPPDHLPAEAVKREGKGAPPQAGPLFG